MSSLYPEFYGKDPDKVPTSGFPRMPWADAKDEQAQSPSVGLEFLLEEVMNDDPEFLNIFEGTGGASSSNSAMETRPSSE
eukprot:6871366-Alexandrium_andersonii.AAC.2